MKTMPFVQSVGFTMQVIPTVLRKHGLVVRVIMDNGSTVNVQDMNACQQRKQALYVVNVSSCNIHFS